MPFNALMEASTENLEFHKAVPVVGEDSSDVTARHAMELLAQSPCLCLARHFWRD
jgi:hypothetical protein